MRVQADSPLYAIATIARISDTRREVRVVLAPGAVVSGLVVDEWSQAPIEEARVWTRGAQGSANTAETRTNNSGYFEFSRISIGNYTIHVDDGTRLTADLQIRVNADIVARGSIALPDIQRAPAGRLGGEVLDSLGVPVSRAEVAVHAADEPDWSHGVRTDEAGHFVVARLPPGRSILSARHASAGANAAPVSVRIRVREETPGVLVRLTGRLPP